MKRSWVAQASVAVCAGLALCFSVQPDPLAILIAIPPWLWSVPGLLLSLASLKSSGPRWGACAVACWAAFLFAFAEEPMALLRSLRAATPAQAPIRIVSLNSAGSLKAVEEAAALSPDILLLQEPPGRKECEDLAVRRFGGKPAFAYKLGAAILARGEVYSPDAHPEDANFVMAGVRLPSGAQAQLASVHLGPPARSPQLLDPSAWTHFSGSRRRHRETLRDIAAALALTDRPGTIFGGDFNAPARDASLRVLQPGLRDTFASAGRGWGATVLNDLPLMRTDQVWVGSQWRPVSVSARKTAHSDHRMVVCDLMPEARR